MTAVGGWWILNKRSQCSFFFSVLSSIHHFVTIAFAIIGDIMHDPGLRFNIGNSSSNVNLILNLSYYKMSQRTLKKK